jgi:hypothetical protein
LYKACINRKGKDTKKEEKSGEKDGRREISEEK